MKILHISTSDRGGAGIAAKRVHFGLQKIGVNSKLLVLSNPLEKGRNVFPHISQLRRRIIDRSLNLASRIVKGNLPYVNSARGVTGNFEIFTTPLSCYNVEDHPLVKEADIIHLHWVSNFLNYPEFFKKLSKTKKLVWTFHDMNPFLGGFHYSCDLDLNLHLMSLESQFREIKREAYSHVSDHNLKVIYLNSWMKEKSKNVGTFDRFQDFIIPNGINFAEFRKLNKGVARQNLGIAQNEKVIMFGCQAIRVRRKGFDLLKGAINELAQGGEDISLLTMGEKLPMLDLPTDIKVRELGYMSDLEKIQQAYSAADVFILPSLEDNLPNVMIEAWACGTPVISFHEGGMRDHISPDKTGILVKEMSSSGLAKAISTFLNNDGAFTRCWEYASSTFDDGKICQRILADVYRTF